MFHILWYLIIGLLAGVISKSVMHVHMTLFWTLVLGVIGAFGLRHQRQVDAGLGVREQDGHYQRSGHG